MAKKSRGPKGMHCVRFKKVSAKKGQKRCAKFAKGKKAK
jgi:hypothetical protein